MECFRQFVGIDWATEAHQICVVDARGAMVAERQVQHSGPGIASFVDWLTEISGGKADVAVAIETPRGAIVDALIDRGFAVFAINPKQLDRFRDRHSVAGAKDDRRDAFVLADSLRTDEPAFRRVQLDDPVIVQLRELSHIDEDLAEDMSRLTNRLREQLHRFFPQLLALAPAANEPWLWSLLELAPTPSACLRLRPSTVAKILREHRVRRLRSEEVVEAVRSRALTVAPGVVEAATAHIATLLPRLQLTRAQRKRCAHDMEELLDELAAAPRDEGKPEHRDVEILRSLPGVGRIVAATVLAEASRPLRDRDYHALRSQAGVAPVTRQSGKKRTVIMRRACNGRLRNALYHWARVATTIDGSSRAYYDAARGRGHSHGRTLRSLADRFLRMLVAMLKAGSLYDEQRATARTAEAA